mgnify:CR=1 FL=1
MNHILRLQTENDDLKAQIKLIDEKITDMLRYLSSDKFHGVDNNYVHISTDIIHKVTEIKNLTFI